MFKRPKPFLMPAVERVVARRGDVGAAHSHSSVVGSMSLSLDDPLRDTEERVQAYHERIKELQDALRDAEAGLAGVLKQRVALSEAGIPGEFVRPLPSGASEADIEAAAELLGWDDPIPTPRVLTVAEFQSIMDKVKAGIISEHKAREMTG